MEIPFQLKKSLSQNFLNNPHVPEKMAEAGDIGPSDTVLEIGPGAGALTSVLLERAQKVVAVEADARAVAALEVTFASHIKNEKLSLHHADIRTIAVEELGLPCGSYKVVANIPYHLSGILFRQLLSTDCQPQTLVFLIQKEVATRIARDEKESLLSLSVKVYGEPNYEGTVSRNNFTPQPRVDSAIVSVANISKKNFTDLDEDFFFKLLHLGFGQKRKQLLGNLAKEFKRDVLAAVFTTLAIREDVRAEDLDVATWLTLAHALQNAQ